MRAPAAGGTRVLEQPRPRRDGAPRVLALDLSLTATGVARPAGTLETLKPAKAGTLDARIAWLVSQIIIAHNCELPDLVVVEELVNNPRAPSGAGVVAMIHGALRNRFYMLELAYTTVPPATLKKYATGKGNAKKPDMRMDLFKRTGVDCADDNQVDAAWLRLMALDAYGHAEVELPKVQREALVKIAWPRLEGGAA